jgi:hypothetical protein
MLVNTKQTKYLLLSLVLSFYAGVSQGQEFDNFSTSALEIETGLIRLPVLNKKKGLLEVTDLAIGTLLKSHHFNDNGYNESHNGIYLNIDNWSVGTYKNSADVQSSFVTYNSKIYNKRRFELDLVYGVANGYEGWKLAQDDYLPIMGFSAQWTYLKAMLSYDVVAFGLELPLN